MSVIHSHLVERAHEVYRGRESNAEKANRAPCENCQSIEFVKLFRYVAKHDGNVETLPVLSCRNCTNERVIETPEWPDMDKLFWRDMYGFYFGIKEKSECKLNEFKNNHPFYLQHPKELHDYINSFSWMDTAYSYMSDFTEKDYARAGFNIPKVQKRFLFWKYERLLKWKEM